LRLSGKKYVGVGAKLIEAALTAEVVSLTVVVEVPGGLVGRNRHSADRIKDSGGCGNLMSMSVAWHFRSPSG
jgi:hypothetical protein